MAFLRILSIWLLTLVGPVIAADVNVVDGDTFDLDGVRYRIHGIDAPEAGQNCSTKKGGTWECGQAALTALEEIVFSASRVHCDRGTPDGYGRIVAVCWADERDIGQALVERGLAWAFVKYSSDYVADEAAARTSGEGIWAAKSEPAWVYREERWASFGSQAPDPNCPIKGNINREGEHIYHMPWSPAYAKTKISPSKGERWFCDEAEAIAAGWRPAYWGRRR